MHREHFCQLTADPLISKRTPNLNIWEKFLKILRQFTTISENYPLRQYYFRSLKSYQEEKINHTQGEYWFCIHPFSGFQYFRQIVMLFIYVSVIIGDQIDIAYLSKYHTFVYAANRLMLVINIIAFVDLILNFFTGYVLQQEKINVHYNTGYYKTAETATMLSTRKISLRYLRTFFFVDIISLMNIIHLSTDLLSRNIGYYYIFACLRHIRLFRIITVDRISNLLLTNVRIKQDLMVIIQVLFLFSFSSFFFGTLLIYIPEIMSYMYNEDRRIYVRRLEIYYDQAHKELTHTDIFMHSTNDAFCLLTVFQTKEVDKTVELYIIVIVTMVVGNILRIFVFVSIYSIIFRRFKPTINHMEFMQEVKDFVVNLNLNKQLALDVYDYFNVKLKKEYFNESEIHNTLQRSMQYEIFSQSSMGLIRNCHLFRNLPNYFVVQLSLRLKCETYVPGVTVITVGEISTCMYFIATGTVAVYSADGTELCHLSDGEYVGEIGLLQSTARVADIVTIEQCELYRLDIKDFQEVIKPNSKFYKRIYKIATKRMNVHVNIESENNK